MQRNEGSEFIKWVEDKQILQHQFNVLSNALNTLLHCNVREEQDKRHVWAATPAVLDELNKQTTYEQPGAPSAYAWLYLRERYVRTWFALEHLLKKNCLPMGKDGVRVLDIATGPGPSAFAIHDFYNAIADFAALKQNDRWRQHARVTCVEIDPGTNQFRHQLAEQIYQDTGGRSENILSICNALPDVGELHPVQEREQIFEHLSTAEDTYYDEVSNELTSDLRYSLDEANDVAQSAHRYRLLVFSNFLTTIEILHRFEQNIVDILRDAKPGTVLLVIGGPYPDIYSCMKELAVSAGFRLQIKDDDVTSEISELSDQIYREEQRFYRFLKNWVPDKLKNKRPIKKIRNHFENSRYPATDSRVWAYRKLHY